MSDESGAAIAAGNGNLEQPRIGVFICHCGGNISDVIDVQRVAKEIGEIPDVANADTLMFACADPGQVRIEKVIADYQLNRVIVAACSPSLHEITFRRALLRAGMNPYLYEHVNIREHVSWVIEDKELATRKAIRLVTAAVNRIRHLIPLEKRKIDVHPDALVIGGGMAGLTAARDLANRGINVKLVENEPFLGGRVSRLPTVFPTGKSGSELIGPLIKEVVNHPLVDVMTYANVVSAEGQVGAFKSKVVITPRGVTEELKHPGNAITACPIEISKEFDYGLMKRKAIYIDSPTSYPPQPAIDWNTCDKCGKCSDAVSGVGIDLNAEPKELVIESGIIILATGNTPYEPMHAEFGSGVFPEVVTLQQLNRMFDPHGPTGGSLTTARRQTDSQDIKNVAVIHCVGARQVDGVCMPPSDGNVKDYCTRTCCTASLHASLELKKLLPDVNITHFYKDIRTYGRGHEEYYTNASEAGIRFVCYPGDTQPKVAKDPTRKSKLIVTAKDTLTDGIEVEAGADMVVLATGVGPHDYSIIGDLYCCAVGKDGFLMEVHPKLRPVELAVSGVFLGGSCQGPMSIDETARAASAAASKAAAMITQKEMEKDPFIAKVDEDLCTGCKTCLMVCPYEAITFDDEKDVALISEATCAGCGTCVAGCPSNAINQFGFSDKMVISELLGLLGLTEEPVTVR